MNVGEQLLESGDITAEQLSRAIREQKKSGIALEECLVSLGFCSERELFYAYSKVRTHADMCAKTPFTLQDVQGLLRRLQVNRCAWIFAFLFGVLSGVFSIPIVFSSAVTQIVDVALPANDLELLKSYLLFAICATTIGFVFYFFCWLSVNLVTSRLSRELYLDLNSAVRATPASMFRAEQAGVAVNLVLAEVDRLTSKVRIISSVVFQSSFGLFLGVLLLFTYDVVMAVAAIAIICLSIWLPNKISAKATVHARAIPENNSTFFERSSSYFKSGSFFRLNGFLKVLNKVFAQSHKALQKHYFLASCFHFLAHATKVNLNLVLGVVVLWMGAYLVELGSMTVGETIGFYFLVMMLMHYFNSISGLYGLIVSMKASWLRIDTFLNLYSEDVRLKNTFVEGCSFDITLSNISIVRSESVIVERFSLEVRRGDVVGIIGGSGCGKSSILQAMVGLVNISAGEITVGGHPINNDEKNTPWADVRYVPQSPSIFDSLSVKENITLFAACHIADDDVWDMLDLMGIKEVIHAIPGGLHAPGFALRDLSTGQIQRLGLTRLLTQKNRLVLVDEPTSNLDKESSERVFRILRKNAETLVLVTHNNELLSACNRVIQITPLGVKEVREAACV